MNRDLVAEREFENAWRQLQGEAPRNLDSFRKLVEADAADADIVALAREQFAAAAVLVDLDRVRARRRELQNKRDQLQLQFQIGQNKAALAETLAERIRVQYTDWSAKQIGSLSNVVNALFARMHANRIVDTINFGDGEEFLQWAAGAGESKLNPGTDFSQGQRQDLALSLFLSRAISLGGTFMLDEPITHLDDLNRVGLLDALRTTVFEGQGRTRLLVTTASRSVARHLVEKFRRVELAPDMEGRLQPPLRVVELRGNARVGVTTQYAYP